MAPYLGFRAILAQPMTAKQFSIVHELLRGMVTAALLLVALGAVHYQCAPSAVERAGRSDLRKQVVELTTQVERLRQEQGIPASMLDHYRNSVGYIYSVYRVGFANQRPALRARSAGTGFLVGNGLVATNRHVAEPWYGDAESEGLIRRGASTTLENLVVFFPGSPTPIKLLPASVSKTSDLAILRAESPNVVHCLPVLPLAKTVGPTGQLVTLIGYPLGIAGMVAKAPTHVYERLNYRKNEMGVARELAALSLVRPSVTYGHLGDVVNDKLIYDAPTAHGGSGGPVFNARGEVIGVNFAYMDGFSGATLGVSVDLLRPLLQEALRI
jgi:S1-C subfamily serine protease